MDWKTLIAEIQAKGLSQEAIRSRLGKSQAWVSAAANGRYIDLKWRDGEALRNLYMEVTGHPVCDVTAPTTNVERHSHPPECGSIDPRWGERRTPDKRQRVDRRADES